MKVILTIIDGLGDRPIPELENLTPLEAARKPNLNKLAKSGVCGVMNAIAAGVRPGSDTSHLAILGYDPRVYYFGRGPFEAVGIGMDVDPGDIALRVNLGTVEKNFNIIDRRAGRIENVEPLIKDLNDIVLNGVRFSIKAGTGHRAALVLKGKNLSQEISDGDPHITGVKVNKILPKNKTSAAKKTAEVLNKFLDKAYKLLEGYPLNKERIKNSLPPANYLLVRGVGKLARFEPFNEKYGFSKSCCIAGAGLYKGIALVLGMDIVEVKGATGLPNTNLERKFKTAKEMTKVYDFVFLHIKAADSLGEDGNFRGKKEFIEKIDKASKHFLNLKNTFVVVTADHSTPCCLKAHSGDPVPLMITGPGVRTDNCFKFEERECAQKGCLGKITGLDLMPEILNLIGKNKIYGA